MRWLLVLPLAVIPRAGAPSWDVAVAAPRVIMFYGEPLARRVYLTDWEENLRFMLAVKEAYEGGEPRVHERPHIKVALFWGGHFKLDSASLERLKPDDAQPARFLPAYRDLPPIFDYRSGLQRISPEGLKILSAHGIPTRLD